MESEAGPHHLDPSKTIRLYNIACIYCGRPFGAGLLRTDEHVVGRRFVPKGSLDGQWNLIASACLRCNGLKAGLEADISAITMQPNVLGQHLQDDPLLREEAKRKGGAISHFTKKRVADSQEKIEIETPLFPNSRGVMMTFSLTAPPTMDENRAFHLAWFHIRGFFYKITWNPEKRIGRHWLGEYMPLTIVRDSDWGNPLMRSFQDLVLPWHFRLIGATDYFAVSLRRSPDERPLWSWALEWNRTFRLIGFVGNAEAAKDCAKQLVWPESHTFHTGPNASYSVRTEQRIAESDDRLFEGPPRPPSAKEEAEPVGTTAD